MPCAHFVFRAMQCVRDRYPALFSPAKNTMQLFMWQHDIVGVAHFIKDCFEVLGALVMLLMMHQPHLHQPWRLDKMQIIRRRPTTQVKCGLTQRGLQQPAGMPLMPLGAAP